MDRKRKTWFDALGRLFRYPTEDYAATARELADALTTSKHPAAANFRRFLEYVEHADPDELEETYTRTFDLNPACAAEIGWHLFGEEYLRGLFMVRIREEMRTRGLEETAELPDHIVHLLALLAAMETSAARELARACVCPAVGKMQRSLEEGTSPFRPLVEGLAELLLEEFQLSIETLNAVEGDAASLTDGDPLHGPPCAGCSSEPSLVPLNSSVVVAGRATRRPIAEPKP